MQRYKQGLELWGLNVRSNNGNTVTESNFLGTIIHANTANRTYTFPDKNGTVALLSDISAGGLTNPMTTLGDVIYGGASGAPAKKSGSTSSTVRYMSQTGTGSASAAPDWSLPLNSQIVPAGEEWVVPVNYSMTFVEVAAIDGTLTVDGNVGIM